MKAIMQYRNTPDEATGISPAMYMFHRPIRDFLPDTNVNKVNGNWDEIRRAHQAAREQHTTAHKPGLNEKTHYLKPLQIGNKVFIQNQTGPSPMRWDHTGTVTEVKQFDQYVVKMDHSGRSTLRNRKYLRFWDMPTDIQPHTTQMQPVDLGETHWVDKPQKATPKIIPVKQPTLEVEVNDTPLPSTSPQTQPEEKAIIRQSQRVSKPPSRLMYETLGQPKN